MPMPPRPSAEHGRLISKLDSMSRLNERERHAVAALPIRTRSVGAGQDLVLEGVAPSECCFVVDGLVCRYAITGEGGRQIVSFHIPGDLPDRDSLHLSVMDHTICAVSSARIAFIPHAAVVRLVESCPNVGIALWRDSVVDGGIYRQWLTSVGRRTAKQRLAHLICETFARMEAVGLADTDHFHFPVTQVQLGDALGLTAVHVNRMLQELRRDGLVSWNAPVVSISDHVALRRAGDFDAAYLQLKPFSPPN